MTVRKLRAKQRGPQCSFCDRKAVWRGCDFTKFACADHHPELAGIDQVQMRCDAHESDGEFFARIPR